MTGSDAAEPADVVHRVAASALVDWIEGRRSFFYVRGYSRRYQAVGDLSVAGSEIRLQPRPLPDLLMHYLLNVAPGSQFAARDAIDREIDQLTRSKPGHGPAPASHTT